MGAMTSAPAPTHVPAAAVPAAVPAAGPRHGGDVDIATVAALFADPTRARVLTALADGRSLPASVLASEAGVSPQAASTQLNRLTHAGLIVGEKSGRHRYYRLTSDQVASVLEALATISRPTRSAPCAPTPALPRCARPEPATTTSPVASAARLPRPCSTTRHW